MSCKGRGATAIVERVRLACAIALSALLLVPSLLLASEESGAYEFAVAKMEAASGEVGAALKSFSQLVKEVPNDPYVHIEYARLLLRTGRLKQAVSEAGEATARAPSNVDALQVRAHALLVWAGQGEGSLAGAYNAYQDVLKVDPQNLQALYSLAQIDLGQGRFEDAAAELQRALALEPKNPRLEGMLVDACSRMTSTGKAQSVLGELLGADPSFLPARLALADLLSSAGKNQQALTVLSGAEGKDRNDPDLLGRLAVEQLRVGHLDEALVSVNKALVAEPDNPGDRFLKGLILSSLGRDAEAETLLRELAKEGPLNADVAINLAQVLEREGKKAEAVQVLRELEEKSSQAGKTDDARRARMSLALLYGRHGEWQSAANALAVDFTSSGSSKTTGTPPPVRELLLYCESLYRAEHRDEALALLSARKPKDDRVIAARAEMLLKMGRGKEGLDALAPLLDSSDASRQITAAQSLVDAKQYGEAIKVAHKILAKQPDSVPALFVLGASLERSGERPAAVNTFQDLLKQQPDFAPALNYLGYMWAEKGENLERALALTQRAVALDPTNGAYLDSLGWANYQLGNYDVAKKYLRRAVKLTGSDATVLEHLGDLYLKLGDQAKAREYYEESVARKGDNLTEVKRKLDSLAHP